MSTVIPETDEIIVSRGGTEYRTNIGKLASAGNFSVNDFILLERGGITYRAPAQNFAAFQDTDALFVSRMGTPYHVNVSAVRAALVPPVEMNSFTWNQLNDTYSGAPIEERLLTTHLKMRRCVISNAGAIQYYLDGATSTSQTRTRWMRLKETTTPGVEYTGTHTNTFPNNKMRALATTWSSGVNYKVGDIVVKSNVYYECLIDHLSAAASAPDYGTLTAATLTTTTTPVMVQIPLFSVSLRSSNYYTHEFRLVPGEKTDDGFQVHPAFVRANGTHRNHIYVGAYISNGTSGQNSNTGTSTAGMSRASSRTAVTARGTGWHVMGFWDWNALQWLMITEYHDMNLSRAIGLGASTGSTYTKTNGNSNSAGNGCSNTYAVTTTSSCHVSYRGVENPWGVAWQWMDGVIASGTSIYLCKDPTKWGDALTADYVYHAGVPTTYTNYKITNINPNDIALLPSSAEATSSNNDLQDRIGDGFWTNSDGSVAAGMHGGFAGTYAQGGDYYAGPFMKNFFYKGADTYGSQASRIAYYPGG